MIFRAVQLEHKPDITLSTDLRRSSTRVEQASVIIRLSHVCHSWRWVALGCSGFWTRTDGHNIAQLDTFIKRSKHRPLSLFMTTNTTGFYYILDNYGNRIERLDITICEEHDLEELAEFVDHTSLQCLTLNHEIYDSIFKYETGFLLLGRQTLPIKALSMVPFAGHFPVNRFPNLTHLHLTLCLPRDPLGFPRPHSSSFFSFLRNTPQLTFLTISGIERIAEGFSEDGLADGHVPVPLPNLRYLVLLASDMTMAVAFLQRVELPETAFVRLHSVYAQTSEVPLLPPLGVVTSVNSLSLTTQGCYLDLLAEGPSCGLWLNCRMRRQPDSEGESEDEDNDRSERNWSSWLLELPTLLPLSQITHLDILVGPNFGILSSLLSHMVGLTELSVHLDHYCERMEGNPDCSLARLIYLRLSQTEPLICPALRTLNMDVKGPEWSFTPDLYPDELKNMILFRRRIGHPVHSVVIQPFGGRDRGNEPSRTNVVGRFDKLKPDISCVEVLGPNVPAIVRYAGVRRGLWNVEGAEEYWPLETRGRPLREFLLED